MNEEQRNVMASGRGFIAALDQSGGSTPKALQLYGISQDAYHNDEQMFDLIHQMRERLMSSPSFSGDKILATILFEQTMDRAINGEDTGAFLWKQKHIVPFVKVDQGLSDAENGVQLMKPMTKLDSLLERAAALGIFGTKMRSFIKQANRLGIQQIVNQQFELAAQIIKPFAPGFHIEMGNNLRLGGGLNVRRHALPQEHVKVSTRLLFAHARLQPAHDEQPPLVSRFKERSRRLRCAAWRCWLGRTR